MIPAAFVDTVRPGALLGGKYRVERVLGEGGMGVVVARHVELDQRVAIKFLLGPARSTPSAVERFLREARRGRQAAQRARRARARRGRARGRRAVHRHGVPGGRRPRRACSRSAARCRRPRPSTTCSGLRGHRRGARARHRPPRPQAGEPVPDADAPTGTTLVKVLDFGISKQLAARRRPARASSRARAAVIGSPLYMSPEQLRPRATSTRAPTSGRSASSSTSS